MAACLVLAVLPPTPSGLSEPTRAPTDDPQAVVLLHGEGGRLCSGSLVLPDVILTAAHCVDGAVAAHVTVGDAGRPARRAREIVIHPGFATDRTDPATPTDLALVALEPTARFDRPRPLSLRPAALGTGEHVTLVGYGGTSPPTRRIGTDVYMPGNGASPSGIENRVAAGEHVRGRIYLEGAPTDLGPSSLGASADRGDSGAPILDEEGRVAAVVVAVSRVRRAREPHRVTWASDITSPRVRRFLAHTIARLGESAFARLGTDLGLRRHPRS